jgi:uncharacterized protein
VRGDQRDTIRRILGGARHIAVVGASDRPFRPSHGVTRRLLALGYEVTPVNPSTATVLGLESRPSLADVPGPIDLVDVFRAAEHAPEVVREAISAGARAVWLQSGVRSPEARRLAEEAGLLYVEDACLAVEAELTDLPVPAPA